MTDFLEFTGERFTPECVREIWLEHWHRYAFATTFARDRRVLDAACGEGYGSALLARHAHSVVGLDVSTTTIEHAKRRYAAPNLHYAVADVTALDQMANASFDLIVSFETLEHVARQSEMLAGFRRLLAPGGLLLVSTPDKRTYTDLTGVVNEHHVRELYRPEFEALVEAHFPVHRLLAQKLLFQSVLWDPDCAPTSSTAATMHPDRIDAKLDYDALYYIALCAMDPGDIELSPGHVHLFGDAAESVYRHYNDEIRKHIAAGHRLVAQENQIAALQAEIARLNAALQQR